MKKLFYSLAVAALATMGWSCTSSDADNATPAPGQGANAVEVMAQVENYLVQNDQTDALANIASVDIDEQNNRVIVGLATCDEAAIAAFKSTVCDSPVLSFEQRNRVVTAEPRRVDPTKLGMRVVEGVEPGDLVTIRAGRDLWKRIPFYNDFQYIGCVAYRAKRSFDGTVGFVLPATDDIKMGETIYTVDNGSFKPVGAVIALEKSQTVEAAFCALTANVTSSTNSLPIAKVSSYSSVLNSVSPKAGDAVFMFGEMFINMTAAPASGFINKVNAAFVTDNNKIYTGMINVGYSAKLNQDDRGGIVTTSWPAGTLGPQTVYVLGMHFAIDGVVSGYAIPTQKINDALELSLY